MGSIAWLSVLGCTRDHDVPRTGDADEGVVEAQHRGDELHVANEAISLEEGSGVIGAQAASALAITSALCNRAEDCAELGEGGPHESREHCFRDSGKEWMGRLSGQPCERGIDLQLVEACLDLIRNDKCQNPFDTLARLTACQPSVFCPEP